MISAFLLFPSPSGGSACCSLQRLHGFSGAVHQLHGLVARGHTGHMEAAQCEQYGWVESVHMPYFACEIRRCL